jgi:hypothetical protein
MLKVLKKISIAILTISIAFFSMFIAPKTSYAVLGAGDTVIEVGPSLYQQIANTVNSTATSLSTYSMQLKEFVLDGLAVALTKQIIRENQSRAAARFYHRTAFACARRKAAEAKKRTRQQLKIGASSTNKGHNRRRHRAHGVHDD